MKIRAFSLVLREGAKTWFQGLAADKKGNWETLKETFLEKYVTDRTPEKLWLNLTHMHQDLEGTYSMYETRFLKAWDEWEASLSEGEKAPNFLKKERFLAGLSPAIQEKVQTKFLESFEEARKLAMVKDRKLQFQRGYDRMAQPHCIHDHQVPPPQQPLGGCAIKKFSVPREFNRRVFFIRFFDKI